MAPLTTNEDRNAETELPDEGLEEDIAKLRQGNRV